ncbi:hypothetical protein FHR71_001213 [Methylobacterium sp. RAS18]|nr:hypothetical protein [Methylobacterium sp. RAS18]
MRLKDHAETSAPKTASIAHLEAILAENASAHDDDEIRAECGITFGMMRDAVTLAALRHAKALTGKAQGAWCFDMEAAPRDGTSVLVAGPSLSDPNATFVGEAYIDADNGAHWWWAGTSYGDYHAGPLHETGFKPYAWHPMLDAPAPPASSGQERAR